MIRFTGYKNKKETRIIDWDELAMSLKKVVENRLYKMTDEFS